MPTPGYRAISKSSRFGNGSATPPNAYQVAMGITSLDNRSYVMSEIEYTGGVSNFYDPAFYLDTLLESYYGLYLLCFVAGPNLLSDLFAGCINSYSNCFFYPGPNVGSPVTITNATDLLNANLTINPKDIDLVTGVNMFQADLVETSFYSSLANMRMIASFHIPVFSGQNVTGWNLNQNSFQKVSQKYTIPPGYKYLVTLPINGLTGFALGPSQYVYNGSFRCSLELPEE
jgi:hypothetical protein